jgi:hypothetical protein
VAVARMLPTYVEEGTGAPLAIPEVAPEAAAPPAGGAAPPPADPPPVADTTTKASTGADPRATLVCLVLFAIAALISLAGDDAGTPPLEGLTAFALFYVAAFVVERFMEPFASIEKLTPAVHERARDAHLMRAAVPSLRQESLVKAAEAQDAVDRWRANRGLVVVGVATVIGATLAVTLRLDFLDAVGATSGPAWMHAFATALVIGGGTKPLHDLLTRIQKSKDNAKDPKEVGGNA